jgi:flavin-dependent dehydrogenase
MNKKKIKIIGAGISGLTAAINLKKAGYIVEVYEKNKDVGLRFNGDMQGLENWSEEKNILEELNEIGIKINFECTPFNKAILSNTKEKTEVRLEKPFFYLIKRGQVKNSLDNGLKKQAIKEGVKIIFNKTIEEKEADIVATGPMMKKIPYADTGIVFKTKSKDRAILIFNDKLGYKEYSYLLVHNKYGCMCSMVADDLKKVNDCFKNLKEYFTKNYSLDIQNPKKVGGIGSFCFPSHFKQKYGKQKVIYVGEAAGLQDFFLGFGMRYAFQSGFLAAKSIIENKNYKKMAKNKFNKKLKASIVSRYLFEKYSPLIYYSTPKFPRIYEKALPEMYKFNLIYWLTYPFAKRYFNKKYSKLKK